MTTATPNQGTTPPSFTPAPETLATRNKLTSLYVMDPTNPVEYSLLTHHRAQIGWSHTPKDLEKFRRLSSERKMTLFWILDVTGTNVGHVALAMSDVTADAELGKNSLPELGDGSGRVVSFSLFSILPEFRSKGLASSVLAQVQELAVSKEFGREDCEAIALDTISKQYFRPAPDGVDRYEGIGMWEKLGAEKRDWADEKTSREGEGARFDNNVEEWYGRHGWEVIRRVPRYPVVFDDGEAVALKAVVMVKKLKR